MSKPDKSFSGGPLDNEEKALRNFLRTAGYEPAPADLSDRVIARIQEEEKQSLAPVRPLIPGPVWVAIGIVVVASIGYALFYPSAGRGSHLAEWLGQVHFPSIQIDLSDLLSVVQFIPGTLALLLPVLLLQLYFIRNFYEGRYSR
ncbi:MAG: hypothetical protein R2787_05805 [Saprospiraceae bacterium]